MEEINSLELWQLHSALSVVDAAILMCGEDPDNYFLNVDGKRIEMRGQPNGYPATLSALKTAILENEIQANVAHSMRGAPPSHASNTDPYETYTQPNEERISYDMLICRQSSQANCETETTGQTLLNFNLDDIQSEPFLYICKEPNWEQTTVRSADLKQWLKSRDIFPHFFFPRGNIESFRSMKHPRYSSKLACVVAAWEAVTAASSNKSVKQTLAAWILKNGAQYGVGKKGNVTSTIANKIATIANWEPDGGAIKTSTRDNNDSPEPIKEPVQNYKRGPKDR